MHNDILVDPDDPYGENFLAHYGVSGMKWGVRRSRSGSGFTTRKGIKAKHAYAKAAKPKILNALKVLTTHGTSNTKNVISQSAQKEMRSAGKDNINGYLQLAGQQALVGSAMGAALIGLDIFYGG